MKNVRSISICIPTYNRPNLLLESINSCLNQTILPEEILIGDDSSNDQTRDLVKKLTASTPILIKYLPNRPPLQQALNVNRLISEVKSEYTVLLHDDDILLHDSLENLINCFDKNIDIDVAYGKQYIISHDGLVDIKASEDLNKTFYRTSKYSGSILTPLEAGFLQQFPNDCYMIKSLAIKNTMYSTDALDACDFDFALRCGIGTYKTFFIDIYTAKYRLSEVAVSKDSKYNAGLISFLLVEKLNVAPQSLKYKEEWLRNKAPVAIAQATALRQKKQALEIYFSKWHTKKIISLGGMKRLLMILVS